MYAVSVFVIAFSCHKINLALPSYHADYMTLYKLNNRTLYVYTDISSLAKNKLIPKKWFLFILHVLS